MIKMKLAQNNNSLRSRSEVIEIINEMKFALINVVHTAILLKEKSSEHERKQCRLHATRRRDNATATLDNVARQSSSK